MKEFNNATEKTLTPEQSMALLCRMAYEKEKQIEKNLDKVQAAVQELICSTKGVDGQECAKWFNNREWLEQHMSFVDVCNNAKGDDEKEELIIYSLMKIGAPNGTSDFIASFLFAACAIFGIRLDKDQEWISDPDKLKAYISDIFGEANSFGLRGLLETRFQELPWGAVAHTLGKDDLIAMFDQLQEQGYMFYTDSVTAFDDNTNFEEIIDNTPLKEWTLLRPDEWLEVEGGFVLVHYYYSRWIAIEDGVPVYCYGVEIDEDWNVTIKQDSTSDEGSTSEEENCHSESADEIASFLANFAKEMQSDIPTMRECKGKMYSTIYSRNNILARIQISSKKKLVTFYITTEEQAYKDKINDVVNKYLSQYPVEFSVGKRNSNFQRWDADFAIDYQQETDKLKQICKDFYQACINI